MFDDVVVISYFVVENDSGCVAFFLIIDYYFGGI